MTAPISYQLNDEELEYLAFLLGTIDEQNWHAFGHAVVSNPSVFKTFARKISKSSELNGMTILHACVRHNPPHKIVKLLLDLVPEGPSCVDCLQRTPLHVAAGTRASSQIIKLLAESYPRACAIQDLDGKTPLHLACDSGVELFEGDNEHERCPPSYEVVRALVKASPLTVPVEDDDGMSPLEHAIFSDAPIKVVKLLQHVTRKQCEARRSQQEQQQQQERSTSKNIDLKKSRRNSLEESSFSLGSHASSGPLSKDRESNNDDDILIAAAQGNFSSRRRSNDVFNC